jgi:ubiquinone/menaquinone biosynthesis C-methylase UbiE
MEHQARVARLFDDVADVYDTVGVPFFQPIADGLVDALAPSPGERALDVGCGTGAVLLRLAARVAPGGSATGIDVAPRMVDVARATLARAGLTADVHVDDAMDPTLPGASFDLVSSSLVLFFLPDPAAALVAWRALLVDGGRLGVSTFGAYSPRWREEVDDVLRAHAPAPAADARTTGTAGPFASDEGMASLVRDAGFTAVRTVTGTVSPRFANADHWYRWSMSHGQRQFWAGLPDAERAEVRARLLAAVEGCRDADGRIGFDQQVRYTLAVR